MNYSLEAYDYSLPSELIADRPLPKRDNSKLLVYKQKSDQIIHSNFSNLGDFLPSDTLLVLNESKVFPCRLLGRKATGGKVEVFVLSLNPDKNMNYKCLVKTSSKKEVGAKFEFQNLRAIIKTINADGTFGVSFSTNDLKNELNRIGLIPIPPYVRNGVSDEEDRTTYQTVYAREVGSVAAPTAGFHFTDNLLDTLFKQGILSAKVTLHVGMGTFSPVKSSDIREHNMHYEYFKIEPNELTKINNAGPRKIIAVGTTSLRVLESSLNGERFELLENEGLSKTNIFLYPGKEINSISGMITNFHLPKSSLIMLISAIIGREKTLEIYKEAIDQKYRFYSYGDAMLILRNE